MANIATTAAAITNTRFAGTLRLATRNVFRHGVRTSLTLLVISAGVAGLILCGGFVEDALTQLREATIHSQLGHLQIYRKGYYENGTLSPYKYLIESKRPTVQVLTGIPEVQEVTSRLAFAGVVNNGRTDFAIIGEGIEPDGERQLGSVIQYTAGRALTGDDKYGIALGEGVAAATKLQIGDRATILVNTAEGALNNVEFDVVGIFKSFSKDFDAHAVRTSLDGAQELLATSAVNSIVVLLRDTDSTDQVAQLLSTSLDKETYEVKRWYELADFYSKTVALYRRQFAVLEAIILIAVILSVVNGVNMSIFERTGEFGTLMAMGTRGRAVFQLVLLENILLGAIGSTVGLVIGVVAAAVLTKVGIPMPPPPNSNTGYTAGIELQAATVAIAWIIGFVATGLAAILPARRVSKLSVVYALRQN